MSKFGRPEPTPEEIEQQKQHLERVRILSEHNTSALPPHDPDKTCPKCGADAMRIPVTYHRVAPATYIFGYGPVPETTPCAGKNLHEHLCRTCGRCGHSWQEACVTSDAVG